MSRIGRLPIDMPAGVTMQFADQVVRIKGPKGELEQRIPEGISVALEGNRLVVTRGAEDKRTRAFHGMSRALAANMVTGVSVGFRKVLEIYGIGFKAEVKGDILNMALGFSHPIEYPIANDLQIAVEPGSPPKIVVQGIDKQKVGEAAATIRKFRPPDSYKGKGIRYQGEYVRIKAGKSAA